jgi:hypothetical protein
MSGLDRFESDTTLTMFFTLCFQRVICKLLITHSDRIPRMLRAPLSRPRAECHRNAQGAILSAPMPPDGTEAFRNDRAALIDSVSPVT